MTERPILFSAPMVRALLNGSKTQTRRVCEPAATLSAVVAVQDPRERGQRPPYYTPGWFGDEDGEVQFFSPYGKPGDRLWVREAYRLTAPFDQDSPARVGERCTDAGYRKPWAPIHYEADGARDNWEHVGTPPYPECSPVAGKLRPGMFMCRWMSRIDLEVTGVRVERLDGISAADAIAEGINPHPDHHDRPRNSLYGPIRTYRDLWEQINGAGSWAANPWVWVVEFRRFRP
jgi:hypothetical protein